MYLHSTTLSYRFLLILLLFSEGSPHFYSNRRSMPFAVPRISSANVPSGCIDNRVVVPGEPLRHITQRCGGDVIDNRLYSIRRKMVWDKVAESWVRGFLMSTNSLSLSSFIFHGALLPGRSSYRHLLRDERNDRNFCWKHYL